MDLISAQPFWPLRDGLPATFPALDADVRCEVAVIGAGITGAFVAWHLAEAGIDTVVLDRREVAHGSTAASTSLLLYELDEPLHRLAHRFGNEFAVRCFRRCRDAIDAIERLVRRRRLDCGFARKTSLQLASRSAHVAGLRREFETRRAAGFDVEWWSRARLARESTLPNPAALLAREAAQVDAYRLTYGLLAAARQAGARIFDRTTIAKRKASARGVELRTAAGRRVRAREVVLASGYEADALLPQRATSLASTFVLASEPLTTFAGWPAGRCLIWETARPYFYLRTTEDGRALIGGGDVPFRSAATRDRLLGPKTAALRRRFGKLFPRIPLEVATAWAGTFANTTDGLPFIDRHPSVPHTWFALGYGGNGVTFSLIAAEIIREAMLGRRDPDAELFSFARRK
ncbi:MAG TPA: FAD-dependent oxidoreductase [Opitutaceae bacterium]|nr:FAD-dependent oxidoreductase [Opitutaceae bacterium]